MIISLNNCFLKAEVKSCCELIFYQRWGVEKGSRNCITTVLGPRKSARRREWVSHPLFKDRVLRGPFLCEMRGTWTGLEIKISWGAAKYRSVAFVIYFVGNTHRRCLGYFWPWISAAGTHCMEMVSGLLIEEAQREMPMSRCRRELTGLSSKLQPTIALLFWVVECDWMIKYKCWPNWILSQRWTVLEKQT